LHDKLGRTAIGFGAAAPAMAAEMRDAEAAPASVKAARASFMARKHKAVGGKGDLVESIASGAVRLDDVQADLPADMKAMPKPEQAAVLAEKQKERNEITKRIDELSALRKKELDAREASEAKEGGADGFDVAAKKALRRSVKAKKDAGFDL